MVQPKVADDANERGKPPSVVKAPTQIKPLSCPKKIEEPLNPESPEVIQKPPKEQKAVEPSISEERQRKEFRFYIMGVQFLLDQALKITKLLKRRFRSSAQPI